MKAFQKWLGLAALAVIASSAALGAVATKAAAHGTMGTVVVRYDGGQQSYDRTYDRDGGSWTFDGRYGGRRGGYGDRCEGGRRYDRRSSWGDGCNNNDNRRWGGGQVRRHHRYERSGYGGYGGYQGGGYYGGGYGSGYGRGQDNCEQDNCRR